MKATRLLTHPAVAFLALAIASAWPYSAMAGPFLVSDPSTQVPPVTGCGIQLTDTVTKSVKKVDSALVNKGCKYDLAGTLPGTYEARATFFYVDPQWGRLESKTTAPLALTVPDAPLSPGGLSVVP